ncbi:hypothetical protein GE061_004785 [Apolygus lucorum]|uniref:RING-type domain-containing protein n=1 Tax=Apolygus lucorum TaxID=248454 RepID=A0A8S9X2S7_APOLU|nr:hypothetical protein GE061_004785 [Apolygus lucorum]
MFAGTIFRTFCFVRPKSVSEAAFVIRCRRTLCSKALMKAVIINKHGGPEELHLAEVQRPSPAKSEVLVQVHAASVNPVDLFIREGAFSRLPPLPLILGKEVAGIVSQVGGDVKNVKEGDRVTCCLPWDGGYSEYAVCDERFVIPLSPKLTFAQGSTLYVSYFVAYRALITKCKIKEGERLFIHGASGGVGISAIQIAKSMGLYVIGSARSAAGRETVLKAGADVAVDHSQDNYMMAANAETGNKGFNVILENCADSNLGNDLMLLSPQGRIAVVGTKRTTTKTPSVSPTTVNPRSLMYTEGCIHGVNLIGVSPDEFVECARSISTGVEAGWLRPHIGKLLQLSQASEAHRRMTDHPANGKIVLNFVEICLKSSKSRSKSQPSHLPTVKMNVQCVICKDILDIFNARAGSQISALLCGHVFHTNCINRWLDESASANMGTCPQCRCVVRKNQSQRLFFDLVPMENYQDDPTVIKANNDLMKKDIEDLRDKVETKMRLVEKLTTMNSGLRERVLELEQQLVNSEQISDALRMTRIKLNKKTKELENTLDKLDKLQKNVTSLRAANTILNGSLKESDAQDAVESLEKSDMAQLFITYKKSSDQLLKKVGKMSLELSKSQEETRKLRKSLAEARDEISVLNRIKEVYCKPALRATDPNSSMSPEPLSEGVPGPSTATPRVITPNKRKFIPQVSRPYKIPKVVASSAAAHGSHLAGSSVKPLTISESFDGLGGHSRPDDFPQRNSIMAKPPRIVSDRKTSTSKRPH